jgi:hypothetical protein
MSIENPNDPKVRMRAVNEASVVVQGTHDLLKARMDAFSALCMIGQYKAGEQVREEMHMLLDGWADSVNAVYHMSRDMAGLE